MIQQQYFKKNTIEEKQEASFMQNTIQSINIRQSLSNIILLMEQQSEYDESLDDSLNELDQPEQEQDQNQQESEQQDQYADDQGLNEDHGKGNRKQKEEDQEEKHDYYAELLPPDEDVETTPPFVVVVQGSKSSGKTSIIRSLIKHFTKYKVDEITGTITLRSNKKQRITIIQCPNDICAMIDLAKVADIVLLTIDASLSFQMETFQFLSLLKCHGFPHVMGVLTHLDYFKDNKQLKKTKQKFKKRFEYEVGGNNKLFSLSKWDKGIYPKIQVAKLARYLGTSKPPAFPWRNNHPYVIADRWQTHQDGQYGKDDQIDVDFYGYIRGSSYRVNGRIHVVGLGDHQIKNIEIINDPCPEFKKDGTANEQQPQEKTKGDMEDQNNEDNQGQGENEKDNVDIGAQITKKRKKRRTLNQSERIIYAPACNLGTLNFDYNSGYVTIPHDYVKFTRIQQEQGQQVEEGVQIMRNLQDLKESMNTKLRQRNEEFELFQGVKIDGELNEQGETSQKQFRKKQTQIRKMKQQTEALQLINPHEDVYQRKEDLMYLIYQSKELMRTKDNSKFRPEGTYSEHLKNLFVTGMEEDVLKEINDSEDEQNEKTKQERQIQKLLKQNIVKATISEQTNFYKKGLYVKISLSNIKYGAFLKMKSETPLILTRVNLGEDTKGFIKVRFKRHRWYSNLLKSTDPIIISSGWRRYQSIMVFATEDQNDRMRYLKYTPQHDFCYGVFYGNFNIQNSGCIFLQTIRNDLKKFRIAGSGLVLEMNKSFEIMKKIKLIGEPYKILKNTAFVKGMFNSSMEVASYIGAQIRTVSGIRGQIKKISKEGGEGTFRATFEDKISMSDLIFCRAWYKIVLQRFYSPIQTFEKYYLMKTKYELRIQQGLQVEQKRDSEYKTIDRAPKTFMPFMVPKKLQAKLPFKTVEKVRESKKQQIRRAQSQSIPKLLQSDKEREVASLIQRLNTIKHMKQQKREEKFKEKARIREAREKPKAEYYQKLKKEQKSSKMASLMRKKQKSTDRKGSVDMD